MPIRYHSLVAVLQGFMDIKLPLAICESGIEVAVLASSGGVIKYVYWPLPCKRITAENYLNLRGADLKGHQFSVAVVLTYQAY